MGGSDIPGPGESGALAAKGPPETWGAPIRVGWASPLRVATGGDANWGSGDRRRRSPAHANIRRDFIVLLVRAEDLGRKDLFGPMKIPQNIPEEAALGGRVV